MGIDIIRINVYVRQQITNTNIVFPLTKKSSSFIKYTLFNERTSIFTFGVKG